MVTRHDSFNTLFPGAESEQGARVQERERERVKDWDKAELKCTSYQRG